MVHTQGGAHTERCTHKAVYTQGGAHERRSVATTGVLSFTEGSRSAPRVKRSKPRYGYRGGMGRGYGWGTGGAGGGGVRRGYFLPTPKRTLYCTCKTEGAQQPALFSMRTVQTDAVGHCAFRFLQPATNACAFPSTHKKKWDFLRFFIWRYIKPCSGLHSGYIAELLHWWA